MGGLKQATLGTGLILCLTGCQGGPDTTTDGSGAPRTLADLERVFAPMQQPLSVAADRLRVDVSQELWDRFTYPSNSRMHRLRRDPGPPTTYRFTNVDGGLSLPLKFIIGRQTYLIVRSAEFRIHRTGKARLDLEATAGGLADGRPTLGSIVVSRKEARPQEASSLRVRDGRWQETR